jgi:hypothetical protein
VGLIWVRMILCGSKISMVEHKRYLNYVGRGLARQVVALKANLHKKCRSPFRVTNECYKYLLRVSL